MADTTVSFRLKVSDGASAPLRETEEAARRAAQAEEALAIAARQATAAQATQAAAARAAAPALQVSAGAVQNLRFQLFDIGQGLASGVNPMVILMQQGPQVAQAMMGAGAGVGALKAAVMGLVGPAVSAAAVLGPLAVLAGGIAIYSREMDRLAEASKAAADALGKAEEATSTFAERNVASLERLKASMGLLTPQQVAYNNAVRDTTSAFDDENAAIEEAIATRKKAGGDWGSDVRALRDQQAALVASRDERLLLAAAEKEYQDEVDKSDQFLADREDAEKKATAAMKARREELDRLRKSEEAYAATHLKVTQMEIAYEEAAFDAGAVLPGVSGAFADLANELDGLVPDRALTDLEKLADLGARVKEAFATGAIDAEQFAALSDAIARASTAPTAVPAGLTAATTAASAVSSPLQAAAAAHPIAAAVVAGIQAAATGGSAITDAADLVLTAVESLDDVIGSALDAAIMLIADVPVALVEGIPSLLDKLAEGIPRVIDALVTMLPDVVIALAEALPAMIPSIVAAIVEAFVLAGPQIVIGLVDAVTDPAFWEALAAAFVEGIGRMMERLGELLDPFADSGTVGKTSGGAGDTVASWWRDTTQALSGSSSKSGGTTLIKLDGKDFLDDLGRAFDLEEGPLGRLLGGG